MEYLSDKIWGCAAMKQGHLVKNWKKRWFLCHRSTITGQSNFVDYFETEEQAHNPNNRKGRMVVDSITTVSDLQNSPKTQATVLIRVTDKKASKSFLLRTIEADDAPTFVAFFENLFYQGSDDPAHTVESLVARWGDFCIDLDAHIDDEQGAAHGAIVNGFREMSGGLPSPMEAEGIVQPGDVLVALNGTDVRSLRFAEIQECIDICEWPLTMRFWRPTEAQTKKNLFGFKRRASANACSAKHFSQRSSSYGRGGASSGSVDPSFVGGTTRDLSESYMRARPAKEAVEVAPGGGIEGQAEGMKRVVFQEVQDIAG
jgi:hypothetical protein